MRVPTRRAALAWLSAAPWVALAGCSEREVVVGPNPRGSKRNQKGREGPEVKARGRRGRPKTSG